MLQLAMVRHKHTPQNSIYVGDRPEDEQAVQRAGIPFQWAGDQGGFIVGKVKKESELFADAKLRI
jgi:histidinol phosphatase-like enzyme